MLEKSFIIEAEPIINHVRVINPSLLFFSFLSLTSKLTASQAKERRKTETTPGAAAAAAATATAAAGRMGRDLHLPVCLTIRTYMNDVEKKNENLRKM